MSESFEVEPYVPERALVIANEHSSHARQMQRQIGQLELPVITVPTHADPRYTHDDFLKAARDRDLLFSAGGDGTAHYSANTVLSEEGQAKGLHNLYFVPLCGGNANDVATMINGRKMAAQILKEGRDRRLHPLEVRVFTEDELASIRYALGYFSVGATAEASHRLEKVKGNVARESLSVLRTVATYLPFKIHRDGQAEAITDFLALRGDRIAKFGRPHANLSRPAFEAITSNIQGMVPALVDMIKMKQGKLHGQMLQHTDFTVEAGGGDTVPVQYDGEAIGVYSGAQISVGISPVGYRTLTTRL